MAIHFIGFKPEQIQAAVKVFGRPDFIHKVWFGGEIDWQNDTIIFAGKENETKSENTTLTILRTTDNQLEETE